jgi:hypothetical protein
MNSSDSTPKLPAWIFIATDLALIGAAVLIAVASPQPLSGNAVLWIVACVGLGAIAGLVPLVLIYEQRKNELLDDRQRALEALRDEVDAAPLLRARVRARREREDDCDDQRDDERSAGTVRRRQDRHQNFTCGALRSAAFSISKNGICLKPNMPAMMLVGNTTSDWL